MRHESVTVLFDKVAARAPSRVAVSRGGVGLTYAELQSRAGLIAQRLLSGGAGKGSIVAILLDDVVAAVTSIIAVLKASAVFAPLDTRIPALRLDAMLADASPDWFITERKFLDRLGAYESARVLCLDGGQDASPVDGARGVGTGDGGPPEGAAFQAAAPSPDDHCYIYFTSGSTGRPKGIAGRLKGIDHFIRWEIEELGVGDGARVSQLLPLSFDGSLRDIFVPLCSGGTLCVPDDGEVVMDARRLVAWLDRERINLVHCVPSLLRAMLNEGLTPENFGALKHVLLTGEALLPSDVGRWMEVFGDRVQLINLYGTSETTMAKFVYRIRPGDEKRRTIPVGKPMPGARALILNEDGRACPPGGIGEIYIRTPYRSLGYYRQPELTREVFVPNPFSDDPDDIVYKTGDLGRLLEDGDVELLGRKDRQVKIRGVRVELEEIEGLLRGADGVKDVAVVDREDTGGNKYLCAYVVGDGELKLNALRELLAERLPNSMLPSAFVVMERLPRTISGKLDRRALPSPAQMLARRRGERDAPATAVEDVLAGLWCEVLGLEQVGVHDNFFELGGHSLLATQVLARAREVFRVEVALRQMFETPTVFGLAQYVETALREGRDAAAAGPIERVADGTRLPLSYAQQRLWLIDQMGTNRAAYNISGVLRLDGDLNVHALEQTLSEITRRHETLRTVFSFADERPWQVITPHAELRLPLVDLARLHEDGREGAAARLARQEASRPFDLRTGPPARVRLLRLSGRSHRLLFVMHHIISDAWSMGVLIREVAALYEAFTKGGPSPLAELPVQYADYAVWQRRWLRDEALEGQLSYWRRQLEGAPPALELPTDRPRPAVKTFKGGELPVSLSAELTAALRALARREGATLHMVLLAGWQALLSRYSGRQDVLVGTPIANRTREEVEPLIGFFVNTLVLRTDLSGDPSFRELLSRVREVCLGAYAHQDVPFETLVEGLNPERSLSRTPLFQVAFALQNVPMPSIELPGLSLSTIEAETGTAKFDLTLSMFETAGGLEGGLEYNADLFDAATAERMAAHFVRLLEGAAAEPGRRVSSYELLSPEERRRVLFEWNDTAREFPADSTAHELFEAQAAARPDAVAVVHGETRLTYGELNRRANRLAHKLRELGVGHEAPVGLFMEGGVEAVVCILAVLKAGGAYVPLDIAYPQERLRFMAEDAGLRLVLTCDGSGAALAAEFSPARAGIVDLGAAAGELALESSEDPECVATPDSAAYVLYTSGSTGRPKGVCVTHRNVVRLVRGCDYASLSAGETILQMAPLSFDASTFELWGALLNGGRLVVMEASNSSPDEISDALSRHRVTTLWLTAGLFHLMVDERPEGLRPLRQLLAGGDVLSVARVARVLERLPGCRLINGYGPTECTTFSCCHTVAARDTLGNSVPIGRPIANAQAYVLDRDMRPVPVGVAGQLYVGGDGLARGYLNRPGLTAERFVPDPFSREPGARLYRTGDVARRLPEGALEFLGREDAQVKVSGFRIEPGEVENALLRHSSLREAAVAAWSPGGAADKRLVAYVVPAEGREARAGELREYLRERLPEFMVPSSFVTLAALPLSPNGKVDRGALPPPEQTRPELSNAYVAPRTPLEELLAGLWAEVLGVERVGVEDNFFDLGGHSLLATQLASRINETLQTQLPLSNLFEAPTVAALSRLILANEASPGSAEKIALMVKAVSAMSDKAVEEALQQRAR